MLEKSAYSPTIIFFVFIEEAILTSSSNKLNLIAKRDREREAPGQNKALYFYGH